MADDRHPHSHGVSSNDADVGRSSHELQAECDKYAALFDHAPVGYVTIDDAGTVIDANLTAARLLGVQRDELAGQPFRAFVFPADRDVWDAESLIPEQDGEPRTFRLRLQRRGGDAAGTADTDHFWARVGSRRGNVLEGEMRAWVTFTDITEGRQERLRLAYITKAVDSSGEAIGVSDAEGHHVFQNRAMSELFGYETAEELEAAGGGPAVIKDPEVARDLFSTIKSGKFWAGELDMVTKSGRVFPAFERADAIRDDEGNIIGLIGIATDITERRKAEEAQAERERWLSESQRIARLGHYVFDIEKDHWSGSSVLNEVLGVDRDHDTHFAAWLEIVHPAERERMSRYFENEVVRERKPFDTEYRIVRPCDGVERWVHGLGAVEYHEDGHPIAMFGTIQDITERKVIENELERERAQLAQAESIGHIGSWRVGLGRGECTWSEEAVKILGLAPMLSDGLGFDALRDAVHPDYLDAFDTWLKAATTSTEPHRADFKIVRPDGEVRWVCAHGAREEDVDEEDGLFLAGILHDVTDAKKIEEERLGRLEEVANVDRLTGLHNLRGFEVLAEQAMAQARRAGQGMGLIFCDVDNLKGINDEFGHAQGDRALQDVASILTFTLRSADAIARIGGDEFIVLAAGADSGAVARLNERLQEGFEFFNATTARPYRILLSSGTAWCEAGVTPVFEQLKATADRAMYAEKLRRRGSPGSSA